MPKKLIKFLLLAFALSAVLYPLWVRGSALNWGSKSAFLPNIFPLFGLTAFALLWLHSLSGVFEGWLRRQFDFDRFIHVTASIILVCIIMHPLLLLASLDFKVLNIFSYGKLYIWFAIVGWLLLITYDIGKTLKKHNFFVRNWNKILIISTLGFLLTFFHSLNLGSDLQSGTLRTIWLFYGITAIIATIYTYGLKRFIRGQV